MKTTEYTNTENRFNSHIDYVYLLLNHISHVIAPYSQLRSLYPPLSTKYKVSAVKYPPFLFLLLLHFSEEM